jgi:hypothetical protein
MQHVIIILERNSAQIYGYHLKQLCTIYIPLPFQTAVTCHAMKSLRTKSQKSTYDTYCPVTASPPRHLYIGPDVEQHGLPCCSLLQSCSLIWLFTLSVITGTPHRYINKDHYVVESLFMLYCLATEKQTIYDYLENETLISEQRFLITFYLISASMHTTMKKPNK